MDKTAVRTLSEAINESDYDTAAVEINGYTLTVRPNEEGPNEEGQFTDSHPWELCVASGAMPPQAYETFAALSAIVRYVEENFGYVNVWYPVGEEGEWGQ